MKKQILALTLMLGLLTTVMPAARATSLLVDNAPATITLSVRNSTTYVPLRAFTNKLCPNAAIFWEGNQAVVRTSNLTLTARPGDCYINANGRMLYIKDGVKLEKGVTMVPVRVLAKALGATVAWNAATNTVSVNRGSGTITSGEKFYDSAAVYWLSRIISAESCSEPLAGKLAVGNVVLNRVASPDFPNCIYDVIFDDRWGGQFEPVRNGTIYDMPTEESVLAAKLCLDGASVVGNSIYFLNPAKASNFWATKNCSYVATIGNHQFYA
jgi:N-acetylmuramoyl-L-alanine amidase